MTSAHPHGEAFLGRDEKSWGSNIGWVDVAASTCPNPRQCPFSHPSQHPNSNKGESEAQKIHLSIAAFRDPLCPRTLHNVFNKASNPNRIIVRLLQQNAASEGDCVDEWCKQYGCPEEVKGNVITVLIPASEARGPTYARALLSEMLFRDYLIPHYETLGPAKYEADRVFTPLLSTSTRQVNTEDYCMQTDSHMDFAQGFDKGLIEMHQRTKNSYAVLSTYVAPFSDLEKGEEVRKKREVPHLCMIQFTSNVRNWGTKTCRGLEAPKLTIPVFGAGLSFSKCHAELKTPYDPSTPNVFDGEEFTKAARLWTNGYDIYTPDEVLVVHDYVGHQKLAAVHSWSRSNKHDSKGGVEGLRFNQVPNFPSRLYRVHPTTDGEDFINNNNANDDGAENEMLKDEEKASLSIIGNEKLLHLLELDSIHKQNKDSQKESEFTEIGRQALRMSRYGLGDRRSMAQLLDFTGFDFKHMKMTENKCGNLLWVPFVEDARGIGYIPSYSELSEMPLERFSEGSIWGDADGRRTSVGEIVAKRLEEAMRGLNSEKEKTTSNEGNRREGSRSHLPHLSFRRLVLEPGDEGSLGTLGFAKMVFAASVVLLLLLWQSWKKKSKGKRNE